MPLSPGTRFGSYEILAPIGAGGMGEVYKARDTKLDREVAVKVLPPEMANDRERLARFEREAKALAALNHPNIAQIYGLEANALIMELIPGQTLQVPQPLDTALNYAKQIAEALEAAHEKGITHRDLKPANIMVTPDGVIKVLDFGLATVPAREAATDPNNSPTLTLGATQAGLIMGTAAYMSPEQAAGKPVDNRSDIWAFGVVLYEMLSGVRLFDGETVSHTLADVLRAPIDFTKLPPSPLTDLVKRCLDRNIKTRLQAIGEARIAIQNQQANPTVPPSPAPAKTRRQWLPWALAAAALAVAAWAGFRKPAAEAEVLQLEVIPPPGVSMGPGRFGQLALSPNGSHLVFIARDRDGKIKLFLRNLKSGSTAALPGTENAYIPFWSPDSHEIAFVSDGRLRRFDIPGNRIVDICPSPTGVRGAWRDDGVILMSTAEHILHQVPAAGGVLTPVSSSPKILGASPATIDGAKSFFYELMNPSRTVLMTPDGNAEKELLSDGGPASYAPNPAGGGWMLYWRTGGRLAARPFDLPSASLQGEERIIAEEVQSGPSWSTSNTGILAYRKSGWGDDRVLRWVDRNGNRGATVGEPGNVFNPRVSPDQKFIVFVRRQGAQTRAEVYDLARQTTARLAGIAPAWMPNSRSVLNFAEDRIVQQTVFGTVEEKALPKLGRITSPSVSPNGNWLLFSRLVVGVPRLVLADLGTGKEIQLGEELKVPTHHGSFSPDGRWLVYTANINGRWDVFVRPVPADVLGKSGSPATASAVQISPAGGVQPVWRADGKEIFYLSSTGMMTAVPIEISQSGVRPGAPEDLFPTSLGIAITYSREYDASADGKRFLLPVPALDMQADTPITVIINWPRLLDRK